VLKKLAVLHLSHAGIPRSHDEFKDVFGFVYRGASFALVSCLVHGLMMARAELGLCDMQRSQLKTVHISAQAAEAVIEAHVKLYTVTSGGAQDPGGPQAKTSPMSILVDDAGG